MAAALAAALISPALLVVAAIAAATALAAATAAALIVALILMPNMPVVMPTMATTAATALPEATLTATRPEGALLTRIALLPLRPALLGIALMTGGVSARGAVFSRIGGLIGLRCVLRGLMRLLRPGNGFLRRLLIAHANWCVGKARSQRCGRSKGRGKFDLGKLRGRKTPTQTGFRPRTIRVGWQREQLLF